MASRLRDCSGPFDNFITLGNFITMSKASSASHLRPLVRRPRPKRDESFRGFALRIDSENSVNLFRARMKSFRESFTFLPDMEAATGRSLSFMRHQVFLMPAHGKSFSQVNVLGHIVPKIWVNSRVKRVCPQCLQERGYMQVTWELHVIRSCAAHQCLLLNQCQSCGILLSWQDGGLFHCRCGANLRSMRTPGVGRGRVILDLLMSESLHPTLEGKLDLWQSEKLCLLPTGNPSRFDEFAIIAAHIATRIGYALTYQDAQARDEQQAELSLHLIELRQPGIEAAFFGMLGNDLHDLSPRRRARLLNRAPHRRHQILLDCFNLNADLHQISFVRDVLLPAWDRVHDRWQLSVRHSLIELEARIAHEKEVACEARYERWKEEKIEKTAAGLSDERRYFETVLALYRENPRLAGMRFQDDWLWFKDRLSKWGS